MNKRIFVERDTRYNHEVKQLHNDILNNIGIDLSGLRMYVVYDVFNIDQSTYDRAKIQVFSEPIVDCVFESLDLCSNGWIAYEPIPGQYDQRSDSAEQCLKLIDRHNQSTVKSSVLLTFEPVEAGLAETLQTYLINPVETRMKDMAELSLRQEIHVSPIPEYDDFILWNDHDLKTFYDDHGFAMSLADLKFIQDYFRSLKRNPTDTELKVLDTYWSDHCRHTTFNTVLEDIVISEGVYQAAIREALMLYHGDRTVLQRDHKPLSLMDIATSGARIFKKEHPDHAIEDSDEVNACSIVAQVDVDGNDETWLLMFKNETHNHPTEIEPFGGASTCIGGAIRDPLSGRAYVYQAMRISGCGDVSQSVSETLAHKLPQKTIARLSAQGNSSYGNQIGLATTYIKEIYHPSYVAKHLELGAVVGAVKQSDVVREQPLPGDVILVLGGRTGRDGIGGATGSSISHHHHSLTESAAEVQKGNAPEERKIQRLFRNPDVTRIIKRSNDFGAGGVSVAIGELADGVCIDLNALKVKYEGLNATERAISESQERMAVVVDPAHAEAFIRYAYEENCDAYVVAEVTAEAKLVMMYDDEMIVSLDRDFLNTSGVQQKTAAHINSAPKCDDPFARSYMISQKTLAEDMSNLNNASQKGLIEMFDGTVGATTVLQTLTGKNQLTPNMASVQKIPVLSGSTTTCSVLAYGFIPQIAEYSPFLSAQYAVIESVAKTVAAGGDFRNIYLSFQEYFKKLRTSEHWGDVVQTLLGAYAAQRGLGLAAIGGKDSMSGSFADLDVVDTFVSFACSPQTLSDIISSDLKQKGSYLYAVELPSDADHHIDYPEAVQRFARVHELIQKKQIISASTTQTGNILTALTQMSFGNDLTYDIQGEDEYLTCLRPGTLVVEAIEPVNDPRFHYLGTVSEDDFKINMQIIRYQALKDAYTSPLEAIYPTASKQEGIRPLFKPYESNEVFKGKNQNRVDVLIPVFPGTNCEYETQQAFEKHGATVRQLVFNNQNANAIQESIDALAEAILNSDILVLAGGFSAGDEPNGSAKYIVNILKNQKISQAIDHHLKDDKLILGICNGFQALLKSGLIPYGKICDIPEDGLTLTRNDINRHVSMITQTVVTSNRSPWLSSLNVKDVYKVPISHGEGKLVGDEATIQRLFENGNVAFQYCDDQGMPSEAPPNGSMHAIEGLLSNCGKILGKMGHNERVQDHCLKGFAIEVQDIFKNGVHYFGGNHEAKTDL